MRKLRLILMIINIIIIIILLRGEILILGQSESESESPPYKAVNLGAWLVAEGWMTPSLFDSIPNKDLLDGTQIQLKSTRLNMYLCAENGGGSALVANRSSPSGWETFRLWRINENTFNLRVFNKDFIGLTSYGDGKKAYARVSRPGPNETFVITRNNNNNRVRIRAHNGLYLRAWTGDSVKADYGGSLDDWSDQNPSVFQMTIVGSLQGEYQLTNGYGPDKAPAVMKNHWNTYITGSDFKFMSENGLTAVRIPVGWWIMYGQNPPRPFVGGSLEALDNAFTWAEQYRMKVIIDLHAAQGSQNGNDHSAARDGYIEWGPSYIPQTVACIDFLANRYASRPGLAAIELMNEPLAPGVTFDDLTNFYRQGYAAVRKYTSNAYVILSNRLGPASNSELLPLANGFSRVVIDVHYYNLYSDYFSSLSAQQNIDYIYNERARTLREVTPSNGPLSFVGEWSGEWAVQNAPMQEYQRYARAQLDVYGRATFGWAYWAYKCQYNHWSLKWMIENNYIKL
ncbi:probable glucan 1,3-beta-glucosidase A [Andrographis paniculata]|uniref:probable glucan 1,3-beta-glucosidase A n=1 Tax=Andrographis paniculata TaxID=175694 RepID=UPI0021E84B9C|nr:probable glucan 1,3-beta-glucosidase A [Andrographis paniculata]